VLGLDPSLDSTTSESLVDDFPDNTFDADGFCASVLRVGPSLDFSEPFEHCFPSLIDSLLRTSL
jgi:hypothetical protein